MNRAEKIQRLEATLVRVLARKDITRIRNVPSGPTGPSSKPLAAKHVGLEAFMGAPVPHHADDLSEVPTSVIRTMETAERPSVPPAPEPSFRIEGRPAAKAPDAEPVVAKTPTVAPEPEPVVAKTPTVAPEPEPVVAKTPTVAPDAEPAVAKTPTVAPEPEPVVAKTPTIAPEPEPEIVPTPSADAEITLEEPEELDLDVSEEPELEKAPEVVPEVQKILESIPAPVEPESLKPPRPSAPAPAVIEALAAEAFAPAPLPALTDAVRVVAPIAAERPRTLRGMVERALSLRPRR